METFSAYVQERDVAQHVARWCGIFTVAAALERKVWITTKKGTLYPNLYVFLVAKPGVGKTLPIQIGRNMLLAIRNPQGEQTHKLAPSSVTAAALIDELADAIRSSGPLGTDEFNALAAYVNELDVFMPSYDTEFSGKLVDLWDGHNFRERRRGKSLNIEISKPCLNILAGTQPAYLGRTLPDSAWDQGFMARVVLIYQNMALESDIFTEAENDHETEKALRADINEIAQLSGKYVLAPETIIAAQKWVSAGKPPVPEHPRLTHYNVRRLVNLLKICMAAAASSHDEPVIRVEDFNLALEWLVEAESYLPDLFTQIGGRGDSKILEETFFHILAVMKRTSAPASEASVIAFLQNHAPVWQVEKMAAGLVSAGYAVRKHVKGHGVCYIPNLKKARALGLLKTKEDD